MRTGSFMQHLCTFALIVSLSSSSLLAQQQPNDTPKIIAPVLNPMVITQLEAGKTDYFVYNGSQIEGQKLDEAFKRHKEDRDYFLDAVKQADEALVAFAKANLFDDPTKQKLADKNLIGLSIYNQGAGKFITVEQFLDARSRYQISKMEIESRIKAITALSTATFPSQIKLLNIQVENQQQQIGEISNYGNINFKEVADFYATKIAEIESTLRQYPFAVTGPTDLVYKIPSDEYPDFLTIIFPIKLTPEEYSTKRAKIREKRNYSRQDKGQVEQLMQYGRRAINEFFARWGSSEQYRKFNDNDWEAFAVDAKRINDFFFTVSYLRARWGASLGFYDYSLPKMWANLEKFFRSNEKLASIGEHIQWDDNYLDTVIQSAQNALDILEERTERLTKDGRIKQADRDEMIKLATLENDLSQKIISSGDVTLLSQLNAFGTFVTGNRHYADAMLYMFRLIAADLYEERMVRQPGGHENAYTRFQKRYQSTQENRDYYGPMFDALVGKNSGKFGGGPGAGGGQQWMDLYKNVNLLLRQKKNEIDEAALLERQLEGFMLPDAGKEIDDDFSDGFKKK